MKSLPIPSGLVSPKKNAVPLFIMTAAELSEWKRQAQSAQVNWLEASNFDGQAGQSILLPGENGHSGCALGIIRTTQIIDDSAAIAASLPPHTYSLSAGSDPDYICLGWTLGRYVFDRYKKSSGKGAQLIWPKGANQTWVKAVANGTYLVRDLVNTPANDMLPSHLAQATQTLGKKFGAKVKVIKGEQLLKQGFPAIYAVGKASVDAPRLVELTWGQKGPKITLVGKGVCFDSGGLDIKGAAGMKIMKKDMGGAAHVLGVASMLMETKTPVRLTVLVPAVENAIAGNAFRPLDIIETRKGLSVEIGNTDAEGRLVLSDSLTYAGCPDLLIDFATLTGAAKVALGPDVPAVFTNDDALAETIADAASEHEDPMWRLPLHQPYRALLDSPIADINNSAEGGYAGAITAALFLQEFVDEEASWAHIDVMAWNRSKRPGRQLGGEAMGARAIFEVVRRRAAEKKSPAKSTKTSKVAQAQATKKSKKKPKKAAQASKGSSPKAKRA